MIRVGIGGWTFEPWRGTFYPKGLPHKRELEFASQALTSIEVNGTFYRTQTPETFAAWAAEVPDGFVFSLKAPRYATNRKDLRESGDSVARFLASGLDALGDKLGPINWQLPPTKRFGADEIAGFLALLPDRLGDRPLRHALEVRHDSFADAAFERLAKDAGVAVVFADSDDYPALDLATADFTYARLQRTRDDVATGYTDADLDHWAKRAKTWAKGDRDVFVYIIAGAKVRNPAAAQALMARLAG